MMVFCPEHPKQDQICNLHPQARRLASPPFHMEMPPHPQILGLAVLDYVQYKGHWPSFHKFSK